MMVDLYEVVGLLGAAFYLLSYAILQYNPLFARSFLYSLMNFVAACGVLTSLYAYWNVASFIIQLTWLVISIYGIIRCFRFRNEQPLLPPLLHRPRLFQNLIRSWKNKD